MLVVSGFVSALLGWEGLWGVAHVIGEGIEGAAQHQGVDDGADHIAITQETGRHRRRVRLPHLNQHPDDQQDAAEEKEDDDASVVPGELLPAPLQSQQQADDGWNEEERPQKVQLKQQAPSTGATLDGAPIAEEKEDKHGREEAKGEVDIEAPAPAEAIGEDATKPNRKVELQLVSERMLDFSQGKRKKKMDPLQGARHGRDAARKSHDAQEGRAAVQRNRLRDNQQGSCCQAAASQPGARPTHDKGVGTLRGAADNRPDLEAG